MSGSEERRETDRRILSMYASGASYHQIASELKLTVTRVGSTIHHARSEAGEKS